jgi:hypothetical protein
MIAHPQFVYQYPGRLFRQIGRSRRSTVTQLNFLAWLRQRPTARLRGYGGPGKLGGDDDWRIRVANASKVSPAVLASVAAGFANDLGDVSQ